MNSRTSILVPVIIFALVALALAALPARAQSTSSIPLMAADVNPAGNGATSFGPVDGCIRVEVGAEFDVDVGVDAVPADRPIIAFEFAIGYDPALVEVISTDNSFLLSAVGAFEPFVGVQDPFPDTDGTFVASVLDVASGDPNRGDNSETGPGVLSRLRFRAKAPGQMTIIPTFGENSVPAVIDWDAAVIPISRLQGGIVAIGQDCPAGPGGPATTPPPVDGGTPPYEEAVVTPPPPTQPPDVSTPDPEGNTPAPDETPGASGSATPANGSPSASRSPSPTPDDGGTTVDEEGDDDGTSAGIIIAALLLAVAGMAAAGAGAWFLLRNRSAGGPPGGAPPAPGGGGEPGSGPGANI